MKNPLIHKVHPLNSQQEGAVPRTSCLFLKTPLNMDTIALGGQTSKWNGRGFQPQFRVADAVSTLGELHGKRANHPYCLTPILRGERGACPQALFGYLPAGSHQQGAQTMLQRAMFQAVQTQQSAGQHISIMPPLGRQRREGHLQCEASWYTPSFRTVRARETDLSQNAK